MAKLLFAAVLLCAIYYASAAPRIQGCFPNGFQTRYGTSTCTCRTETTAGWFNTGRWNCVEATTTTAKPTTTRATTIVDGYIVEVEVEVEPVVEVDAVVGVKPIVNLPNTVDFVEEQLVDTYYHHYVKPIVNLTDLIDIGKEPIVDEPAQDDAPADEPVPEE